MSTSIKFRTLSCAIALALLCGPTLFAATVDHDEAKDLDQIVVNSSPLKESAADIIKPTDVLADEALENARAGTLGETLRGLPGVQSTQFGQAVSRPIIRGLDGARVLMAQGGVSAMDVSTLSVDHAVTVEPFLADQIEVIKGPASLFYGTGAIGGVVNVEDGRLPESMPDRISARAQLEGATVADERNAVFRVDGPAGNLAWHADTFYREADDYDSPLGIIENSALETRGAALGASWITEAAHFGASLSRYENEYGIPLEEAVIDMAQTRVDTHGGIDGVSSFIDKLEFRAGLNNYRHLELEGSEIGTRFDNDEAHLRVDATHAARGGWRGALGLSLEQRETKAAGEEAFVPNSKTRDFGLFWVEKLQIESFKADFGARIDRNRVQTTENRERSFSTPSLALAVSTGVTGTSRVNVSFDVATRAPQAEELFANGPHAATQNFEIGDASLKTERAKNINLGVEQNGERFSAKLDLYHTHFDRFIYLQPNGEIEDDLPVFEWLQRDANFTGFDFKASYALVKAEQQELRIGMIADRVKARFNSDDAVPRVSPKRVGLSLNYSNAGWHMGINALRYAKPEQLAEFETDTDSFVQIDADINYRFDLGEQTAEFYLQAKNLNDETIRLHTSFLKDEVPLPGRNLKFGVRWFF